MLSVFSVFNFVAMNWPAWTHLCGPRVSKWEPVWTSHASRIHFGPPQGGRWHVCSSVLPARDEVSQPKRFQIMSANHMQVECHQSESIETLPPPPVLLITRRVVL